VRLKVRQKVMHKVRLKVRSSVVPDEKELSTALYVACEKKILV
jgi:hypothetical protein